MAFISFPIFFSEDDFEKREELGLNIKQDKCYISVNTQQIVAYNKMDNENILIRMSNGDAYECPLKFDDFEDLIIEVDNIIDLSAVGKN